MKKRLFLLALAGATPVWAQDQIPNPPIAGAVAENAPFVWRLQLRAGQKWLSTTETSTQSTQQMPAMPGAKPTTDSSLETTALIRVVTEQNVLSSDDKGARIEVLYREMTQNSKTRMGDKIIFDSANPPAELKNVADFAKNIVGARISYLLAPDGQINEIQGVEEYLNRLTRGLDGEQTPAQAGTQKTMRASLSGVLSPETLKNSFAAAYRAMPTRAVAPGESWKYAFPLPVGGTNFTVNSQSTFVARQGSVISIAQKGEFATDPGAEFKIPLAAMDKPGAPKTAPPIMQLDLHGETTGEIRIDEKSGMTLFNRSTQNLEGEMVMSGATGKGSVMSIPMKMRTEVTTTTQEVPATP